MKKKKFTSKMVNSIESARPTSVWNYKGCAGKGGKTRNSNIVNKPTEKESN